MVEFSGLDVNIARLVVFRFDDELFARVVVIVQLDLNFIENRAGDFVVGFYGRATIHFKKPHRHKYT